MRQIAIELQQGGQQVLQAVIMQMRNANKENVREIFEHTLKADKS